MIRGVAWKFRRHPIIRCNTISGYHANCSWRLRRSARATARGPDLACLCITGGRRKIYRCQWRCAGRRGFCRRRRCAGRRNTCAPSPQPASGARQAAIMKPRAFRLGSCSNISHTPGHRVARKFPRGPKIDAMKRVPEISRKPPHSSCSQGRMLWQWICVRLFELVKRVDLTPHFTC